MPSRFRRLTGMVTTLIMFILLSLPESRFLGLTALAQTSERPVRSIELLRRNGGRAEWSPDGAYISFHAKRPTNYYGIYVMGSDGLNIECLTCDRSAFPRKHVGQASWHPSGEWIVFQAQKRQHYMDSLDSLAAPGIGFHNDLWIMTSDAQRVYRLMFLETKQELFDARPTSGILQPHFSLDGQQLSWAEKIGDAGRWGTWRIRAADFAVGPDGAPFLANVRTYAPGINQSYYESNDFMPNDGRLLICGNLEAGQTELGIDIYLLDLETQETERLTHSLDAFDECPHPSPDGSRIAYLSTEGYDIVDAGGSPREDWWNWARGEFWLMDANGANKIQLTYFNTEGYPEYTGKRILPAYVSWNPQGNALLLAVVCEQWWGLEDLLYRVALTEEAAAHLPR